MHVDRSRAEVVAARKGDPRDTETGEKGAQGENRRPHLAHQVEWRLGPEIVGNVDDEPGAVGDALGADVPQHLAHDAHVHDPGHVGELVAARSEQRRHHVFEHGVLGAQHSDLARERRAPGDTEGLHVPRSVRRLAGRATVWAANRPGAITDGAVD